MRKETSGAAGSLITWIGGLLVCIALPACAAPDLCPMGPLSETHGERRLALIVGVGDYASDRIKDLEGPPKDARKVYDLLTGERGQDPLTGKRDQGYGFPPENVCLLTDAQATTQRVKEAFERLLIEGAREGKNDVAVFYYAGHGSQIRDLNGDEEDHCDETFLFHDARTGSGANRIGDLVDDDLHALLRRLTEKTDRAVVILDSCNSGTGTRGPSALVARWQDPDDPALACPKVGTAEARAKSSWRPQALPSLVAFTAASDGTPALEEGGEGIFTAALIEVLSRGTDTPPTYAQVARQVPPLVRARSYQIPYFQGDLNRAVFAASGSRRPLGWDVTALEQRTIDGAPKTVAKLSGMPLPGMGTGAELRVYAGSVTGSAASDPKNAKATLIVTKSTDINAEAVVSEVAKDAPAIEPGGLAVMVRPSDARLKIKVRLRPEGEDGGIPAARAEALRRLIAGNQEAALFVDIVKDGDSFELALEGDALVLRGPENNIRNRYSDDAKVPDSLWQHARQAALLALHGEGGADFTDQQTLKVQLVPAEDQPQGVHGVWTEAPADQEQVVPLGHRFNVQVTMAPQAKKPLLIGALVLSSDGSSFGLPCDGRAVLLKPGETAVFAAERNPVGCPYGETLVGARPLDTQDHILEFGTQQTNPVPWQLMTETARTRSAKAHGGPLYRALDRYMRPGTRGIALAADLEEIDETTWTLSTMAMRVVEP